MPHAWEELPYPSNEDTATWAFMAQQLHFHPSVHTQHWPGIVEPYPSITYEIGHIYGARETQATALETDLNRKTLAAFQACAHPDQRLYALDWQHPCYWLLLQREVVSRAEPEQEGVWYPPSDAWKAIRERTPYPWIVYSTPAQRPNAI